jgi:hypothetical protein
MRQRGFYVLRIPRENTNPQTIRNAAYEFCCRALRFAISFLNNMYNSVKSKPDTTAKIMLPVMGLPGLIKNRSAKNINIA